MFVQNDDSFLKIVEYLFEFTIDLTLAINFFDHLGNMSTKEERKHCAIYHAGCIHDELSNTDIFEIISLRIIANRKCVQNDETHDY